LQAEKNEMNKFMVFFCGGVNFSSLSLKSLQQFSYCTMRNAKEASEKEKNETRKRNLLVEKKLIYVVPRGIFSA
jgi:hypothetical protein